MIQLEFPFIKDELPQPIIRSEDVQVSSYLLECMHCGHIEHVYSSEPIYCCSETMKVVQTNSRWVKKRFITSWEVKYNGL